LLFFQKFDKNDRKINKETLFKKKYVFIFHICANVWLRKELKSTKATLQQNYTKEKEIDRQKNK